MSWDNRRGFRRNRRLKDAGGVDDKDRVVLIRLI